MCWGTGGKEDVSESPASISFHVLLTEVGIKTQLSNKLLF